MSETKNNIRVVKLAEMETDYPVIDQNRRFVTYGLNNSYPEYLLDLYLYSPTNNAVIAATSQMIAGEGLSVKDEKATPLGAKVLSNLFDEAKILKTAFNLKTFGYAVWKVSTTNQVIKIDVQNSGDWRSGIKDENGNINEWWYSEDWDNETGSSRAKPYPLFKDFSINVDEVFILNIPKLGLDYYSPVDYTGGVASAQLEAEICEFHLSAIQNGLNPGTIINFNNGVPPDAEQDEIENDVKNKMAGPGNAGRFLISFNDSKESATTLDTMAITDIDKQYEFLSKETTAKVLLSHRVTSPLLFGIRDTGGGLGSNSEELKDSYILYYETVIKPYQKIIKTGVLDILYKNNVTPELIWNEYMPFKKEKETTPTETKLKEHVQLSENDTLKWIGVLNSNKIKAENLVLFNEKPMNGSVPKDNGLMKKLFKFNKISNKKNVLFKVLENAANDENYYEYETIKDFPDMDGMYWTECTFKKIQKDV